MQNRRIAFGPQHHQALMPLHLYTITPLSLDTVLNTS
jgi:hypothetical protein